MSKKWHSTNKEAYKADKHKENAAKFYTKRGEVSAYGLACGYVEHYERLGEHRGQLDIYLEQPSALYEVTWRATETGGLEHALYERLIDARRKVLELKAAI